MSFGPIDYLVIGHLTQDLTPDGASPGGTAAYAALTARALGLHAGIVTSFASDSILGPLSEIPTVLLPSDRSTTFENLYTPGGRLQYVRALARPLDLSAIPDVWRSASIVHLAPVAREVDAELAEAFPGALVGLTLQGWLREWDGDGRVRRAAWPEAEAVLGKAGAAVLSIEDVESDEELVEEFANAVPVLSVTEGEHGARVYWNTHLRRLPAAPQAVVDPTGAGDIYAAAFFTRLRVTRDPYEAGRFAGLLASHSVTRRGLEGIPTSAEVAAARVEVLR